MIFKVPSNSNHYMVIVKVAGKKVACYVLLIPLVSIL